MHKKIADLQDTIFRTAMDVNKLRDFDPTTMYVRYIGELEGILQTLAKRDRVVEGEVMYMLNNTLERFNDMKNIIIKYTSEDRGY